MKPLILLFASSPDSGRGGAATVINSYIDFFTRNNQRFDVSLIPFHRTDISKLIKILRYLPTLLVPYRLLKEIIHFRRYFNRSSVYIYWHSYGILDAFLLFILSPIFSIISKHRLVTLHCPNFYPTRDIVTFSQRLYSAFVYLSRFNQQHLNRFHYDIWSKNFDYSCFFPFKPIKNFVCLNPISNALQQKLHTCPEGLKDSTSSIVQSINIFSLSQLIPGKNIHLLIEAFAHLPSNFKLTIAGEGPQDYRLFLDRLVTKYNLNERVTFVGFLKNHIKQNHFEKADIFCVPSSNDTQSLVNIEAIAANLPIVLVEYPPFIEIYSSIPTIFWAKRFSPESVAHQILIASVKSSRQDLEMSKKIILERFADSHLLSMIHSL